MAHLIDHSKGKAAFVSFQQPAWHKLGKIYTREMTVAEALADSGQDFTVVKAPNVHRMPTGDVVSTSSFFTYRSDVNKVLGSKLGPDYTVYQNAQVFELVDEMLKTKKCRIETAGAIDEGRRVFVLLKLNEPMKVDGVDTVFSYIMVCNSHDGSLAITAMLTNVRVVCNNTLSAALMTDAKAQHRIRHTKNAADRVSEALRILGMFTETQKMNEAAFNTMKATRISKQDFFDYVGNVFATPEEIGQLQKGEDALSSKKKNIISDVIEFANEGIGQELAYGKGLNLWFGLNAVTGYLTGKKYRNADDRFESLVLGDSAAKIQHAGVLALKPNKIQPLRLAGSGISMN